MQTSSQTKVSARFNVRKKPLLEQRGTCCRIAHGPPNRINAELFRKFVDEIGWRQRMPSTLLLQYQCERLHFRNPIVAFWELVRGFGRYARERQMKSASAQMRKMAALLITIEGSSSVLDGLAAIPVIDRLRPHLQNLMGDGGVRALLARSLLLASAEASWLQVARVSASGHLEGLEAINEKIEPDSLVDGSVILIAKMLGLLVALIGPSLSARLIGEVWPQIPLKERNLREENYNG
jgi:hypothetical protein